MRKTDQSIWSQEERSTKESGSEQPFVRKKVIQARKKVEYRHKTKKINPERYWTTVWNTVQLRLKFELSKWISCPKSDFMRIKSCVETKITKYHLAENELIVWRIMQVAFWSKEEIKSFWKLSDLNNFQIACFFFFLMFFGKQRDATELIWFSNFSGHWSYQKTGMFCWGLNKLNSATQYITYCWDRNLPLVYIILKCHDHLKISISKPITILIFYRITRQEA